MLPYQYVHARHRPPEMPSEVPGGQVNPPRWKYRPADSNWGDFGTDDQLGRLNLITAEKVRQGAAEVRAGLSFCLSLPLDRPASSTLNARRRPPVIRPTQRARGLSVNFPLSEEMPGATDIVCDDYVELYLQHSTQWDALSHVGAHFDADGDGIAEMVYYNGFRAGRHVLAPADLPELGGQSRALALGVDRIAAHGVQGRAVMVDLHAHLGDDFQRVGHSELMTILERDKIVPEPGDILCLHTGFAQLLLERDASPESYGAALDGRDPALHHWIIESGIAAIAADNYGVEALPARPRTVPCAAMPLHELCLFKLGMPLGELWHLSPLAAWLRANGRSRFMLTAPPLRLPGAAGSPVTPIGTV